MRTFTTRFYQALIDFGNYLQPFFLLAVRLFWGWEFFKTGFEKFADIESVANFFGTLGIPFPEFNAYLAATTEMVGGFLLIIGLGSRLVSLPLMITMIVALLTAHHEATFMIFDNPVAFVGLAPFTFLMAAGIVFVFGPGDISMDGAIKRLKK